MWLNLSCVGLVLRLTEWNAFYTLLPGPNPNPNLTLTIATLTPVVMDGQKWHRIVPVGYPFNNPSNIYKKNWEGVGAVQYQGYRKASTLIGCRVDRILATGGPQHES